MKTSSSLRAIVWLLVAAAMAGCVSQMRGPTSNGVQTGIAAALASSSLSSYTKAGCLSSLKLWSSETSAAPLPQNLASGLFFLGDSYLVYDFEYLIGTSAKPTVVLQSADSTKQLRISASDAAELTGLVSSARNEPAPLHQPDHTHTTCVVFLDTAGNYFVVYPDETIGSTRFTDRAIALLDRLTQRAP